jgi:pSer/pThr/pTyr-binding forkhead associated (FHA) protein
MAYGRLEVYWPNGHLETHLLETNTVSVGRAEGNTITLDTETISRYHFSIVREAERVTITDLDSANGTFVDGKPLSSNEPFELDSVEEIMIGSLRIIFRMLDDSLTAAMETDLESTQRIEREDTQIRLEMDRAELKVWPASSSSTELAITNLGDKTRVLGIRISGMPSGWLRLTRPEVELDSNETAYILLRVLPPRRPNTVPQQYHLSIEVAPIEDPDLSVSGTLDVEVNPYVGFGMAIGKQVDDGEPIPLYLHNQGSGILRVSLRAYDKQNLLNFNLPQTALELQAGQRLRVDLNIAAKSPPITGNAKAYSFIAEVKSHDASGFIAATEGKITIAPRIPLWGMIAGFGIAISIIIIAFWALTGLLTPREPVIHSIAFNEAQLEQGSPLEITIDAENVKTFEVLVNGQVYEAVAEADKTTITIDTSSYEGDVKIEVFGRNGEYNISEVRYITVFVPITEGTFTIEPEQLVRYTVNTLSISWDIPGAVLVRISGLSDFTNNRLQPSTEYAGTFTLNGIGGIPTEALELTLYAEDQAGNSIEMNLVEPVIDPQCTALAEIALREGPDERYQQVATVPQNTMVVVTAQDADAGWLRVLLAGDVRGWGSRHLFACADTFDLVDLRTEFNVPELPTDAPTLVPTAVPSPEATESVDNNG